MTRSVALAVIRDDPPTVHVAEDLDVLHRVIALRVVASTSQAEFRGGAQTVRDALLEERWADAVVTWIDLTGIPVDVYTEQVVAADELPADTIGVELQFTALFRDG